MSSGRSDADLIVVNANIHTLDPERPKARALAVSGGRIIAVGGEEDVRALAGDQTEISTPAAGFCCPASTTHTCISLPGRKSSSASTSVRPATSGRWSDGSQITPGPSQRASGSPAATGITRRGQVAACQRGSLLDEAAPSTPVFVKRLDGHMALANSEALRRAGVHEDFAAPAGGAVVRDASGRLTGLLKDAAMDAVTRAMPPLSADGLLVRARAALRHAAELGVTSIQDMTSSAEEFSVYEALLASGELTARISSMQNYGGEYAVDSRKSDWLARGGRKFFSDGSMGSSTAAFFEPYSDDAGNPACSCTSPTSSSASWWTRTRTASSPSCTRSATGPTRSSSTFWSGCTRGAAPARLAAADRACAGGAARNLARFARLGVVVSLQPSHCIDDMRWAEARIGRARCATAYNVRSFVDSGAHVAFGTDWFVAPLNPMLGLLSR